jgi:hypothetical protein
MHGPAFRGRAGGAASFACRGPKRVVSSKKLFDMSVSQWVVTSLDSFVAVVKFLGLGNSVVIVGCIYSTDCRAQNLHLRSL